MAEASRYQTSVTAAAAGPGVMRGNPFITRLATLYSEIWSLLSALRFCLFFAVSFFIYQSKPDAWGVDSDLSGSGSGSGLGQLKNRVVFAYGFLEMMFWLWVCPSCVPCPFPVTVFFFFFFTQTVLGLLTYIRSILRFARNDRNWCRGLSRMTSMTNKHHISFIARYGA